MSAIQQARGFSNGSLAKNPGLAQWLNLDLCDVLVLKVGKVEFGQGIGTALAQIAAEELDIDIASVRLAAITTADSPDEGVTSGSFSVQHSGAAVRMACATLRALAVTQYSSRHGVSRDSVLIERGTLHAGGAGQRETYWDLNLSELLTTHEVAGDAKPKAHADYGLVGQAVRRLDLDPKVFGRSYFIQDLVLPRMLHGRVVRQPSRWATLVAIDWVRFAGRFPTVTLVQDGSFLGVLAEREETAIAAAGWLLEASTWALPDRLPDCDALHAFMKTAPSESHVVASHQSHDGSEQRRSSRHFEASYSRPFIAHASIGPSCALAHWDEGRLDVWSHSQGIFNLKGDLEVFMARERPGIEVVVRHVEGAGCYGHNPADDVAFDAAMLARQAGGRPVRVLWSRADELSCGPSGPAHLVELKASLDATGRVVGWNHAIWANGYTARPGRAQSGQLSCLGAAELSQPFAAPVSLDPPMAVGGGSDRNAIPGYDFESVHVTTNRLLEMPIRTSAIRALGGYANVFAIESFIDELAHASGQDPVAFRMAHLSDVRARAVIDKAIDAAPWWHDRRDDTEGTGRGIAYARYKHTGAWCAVAVRVVVQACVRVCDISIAADLGLVINPDGAANQLEGGAIQSSSWTLKEELRFSRSQITTRSWSDYPILLFSEAPVVTVSLIDRPHEPSLGAGEASQGPTAAAIGNAVFDALGVRVRQLPITPDRIVSAMSASS